jgi:hypothetical protein
MNIFSEDHFLNAWGKVYFPGQPIVPELFELDGKIWRLPSLEGKPIVDSTFLDFFEPFTEKNIDFHFSCRKVRYLPRASWKMVSRSEWIEHHLEQSVEAAPTTLWNNFESWDAFVGHVKKRRSKLFPDSDRQRKKLQKELGPLHFIFEDHRPESLTACFRWKSEHWRRQGLPDRFADSDHTQLFQELAHRKIVRVSSLAAQDRLLAVHIGMLDQGRFYYWVPAYAAAYSQYSPGRLLLHFLLEESYKRRHTEFDFLWGDEEYKWYYATHVRLIEEIGRRPLKRRLGHLLKSVLRPFPRATAALRQLRTKPAASD